MKEFQNKQHERLHNALIGAGFTDCGGKNLPNDTGECNYGYINKQLDEYIYFDYCVDGGVGSRVCIRNISNDKLTAFYNAPIDDIIAHYEALAPTQPITKKNIEQFLKYNNLHHYLIDGFTLWLTLKREAGWDLRIDIRCDGLLEVIEGYFCRKLKLLPKLEEIVLKVGDLVEFNYVYPSAKVIKLFGYINQRIEYEGTCYSGFNLINNGHIKSVNGKSGIYKIPEFNFDQYLFDNGFKVEQGQHGVVLRSYVSIYKSELITDGKWTYQGVCIQETLQNAEILIAMAKLAKDLK